MHSLAARRTESRRIGGLLFLLTLLAAQSPFCCLAEDSVPAGSNVTLIATADGYPAPTFEWRKNGIVIAGATTPVLSLGPVTAADAGVYQVIASNEFGTAVSPQELLIVDTTSTGNNPPAADSSDSGQPDAAPSGLVNLSVRAPAGTEANGLILGFVIEGAASKSVLVRGIGPSLRQFGVSNPLSDPQLSLYSGAVVAARNDDWNGNDNAAQIVQTSTRVGAFGLADAAPDSALMAALEHGAYTVHLNGKGTSTGTALVEVYDAAASGINKLANLSVRTYIGSDTEPPNVGFVVAGTEPRMVMIRAIGPSLGVFGVADAISDPQLELYRDGNRLAQNDNWDGEPALKATFGEVGAFALADNGRDAALLTTLAPGAYTVVVTGVNGSQGTGLVEVYDIPPREPAFVTQPASHTAEWGATTTLTVVTTGTPAPTVRWYRDGRTWESWTGPLLRLEALTANDDGVYTAVATNSAGSVTSAPARLIIK